MLAIPSFRAAHLVPYTHFLRRVGTPVDRLLSQARLPTLFEDNLEAYLPLQPALRFLSIASHLEGIEELGLITCAVLQMPDYAGHCLQVSMMVNWNDTCSLLCLISQHWNVAYLSGHVSAES